MARTTQTPRRPRDPKVVPIRREEPPANRKRPKRMWATLHALARALVRRGPRGSADNRPNPFTPATPLPRVVGEGKPKVPQIAMDAAAAFKGALDAGGPGSEGGWVGSYAQGYFASAYAEGQEWLGYAVLALLAQRPEYRVMTDTYATEMTREWIEFKSKSEDAGKQERIDELVARLTELRLKQVTKAAIENDGFQGRGQIYIDTGDEDDAVELKTSIGAGGKETLAKFGQDKAPVDGEKNETKKRIKRLAAIEPMWCYPSQYDANDPLKATWYKPETWWVMGKEVHRTRLLTFVSNPVPDMLKPAYSFGGLSRTQMAKPYVDFYLRNRTSASDLLNTFSIPTLATELDVTTMDEGSEVIQRIAMFNIMRDNQATFLINKDTEEFEVNQSSLAGVKDLVAQSAEHMLNPSQIPIVKYFGDQPSGLNNTSEGVIRLWYDRVHSLQEGLIREPIQVIVNLTMIEMWGEVDDDIEFEFVQLWQLDDAGKAAVQKTKADQRAVDIEAGVTSAEEGRQAAAHDPDSQYAGLDLKKPLPEPEEEDLFGEPGEGENSEGEGGEANKPGGPKPSRRDLGGLTNQSARFGGAVSGGLSARDSLERSLTRSVRAGEMSLGMAMDILERIASPKIEQASDAWNESDHGRDKDGKFNVTAFHGAKEKFTDFDVNKVGTGTDEGFLGKGFYFSTDINVTRGTTHAMEVKLGFKNPLVIEHKQWGAAKKEAVRSALSLPEDATANEVTDKLLKSGYDAVVLDYSPIGYKHQEIMVPDPKQVEFVTHHKPPSLPQ